MSTRWRVVVTRRLPAAVEAALAERFEVQRNDDDHPFTVAELRAAIADADAVLPTVTDRLTGEVFADATGRCKVIANFGVGSTTSISTRPRARAASSRTRRMC